jgi:predicted nucleic acid-binding protein
MNNKNSVFVDTSAWVALFLSNDKNHQKAVSVYEDINKSKMRMFTSDYVIDETITVIMRKSGYPQSVRAGEALFSSGVLKILFVNPDYFTACWKFYRKFQDKDFSFTDVTSFFLMNEWKIHLAFSFDQHFVQAGFGLYLPPK